MSLPVLSAHYEHAILHLEKDRKGIADEIKSLIEDTSLHNSKVEELRNDTNELIPSAFRKPITALSGVEYYSYNFENILLTINGIWNVVKDNDTIELAMSKIANVLTEFEPKFEFFETLVRLDGLHLGDGNNMKDLEQIKNGFLQIPTNREMIETIIELRKSLVSLERRIVAISSIAEEISKMIANGSYRQKAKCCPTFINLVENFL